MLPIRVGLTPSLQLQLYCSQDLPERDLSFWLEIFSQRFEELVPLKAWLRNTYWKQSSDQTKASVSSYNCCTIHFHGMSVMRITGALPIGLCNLYFKFNSRFYIHLKTCQLASKQEEAPNRRTKAEVPLCSCTISTFTKTCAFMNEIMHKQFCNR